MGRRINMNNTELNEFIESIQSLQINSLDEKDFPFSSYAPFVKYNHNYYVYISLMAKHASNLIINNKCSILLIEDESKCKNIFARKRVSIQCYSKRFKQDSLEEKEILEQFRLKFDKNMVDMLSKMGDFYVFEFSPIYGEAVFGFGKAYNLGGLNFDELVERQNQSGHGNK
jgi:putative heme iron utilization protein